MVGWLPPPSLVLLGGLESEEVMESRVFCLQSPYSPSTLSALFTVMVPFVW